MVPKPGKTPRASDGAWRAQDLRPVSVQSVLYRVVASGCCRLAATRQWVAGWAPRTMHGAMAGKGVHTAMAELAPLVRRPRGAYVGSADYTAAFEYALPALVLRCLAFLVLGGWLAGLLAYTWRRQQRWLTLGGAAAATAVTVTQSLPQGDAFSPIGLAALLLGPTTALTRAHPTTTLCLYVDDRVWVSDTATECVEVGRGWERWSAVLGLRENVEKLRFLATRPRDEGRLAEAGVPVERRADTLRVLGVVVRGFRRTGPDGTERARVEAALWTMRRAARLPLAAAQRLRFMVGAALPAATFGWWLRGIPQSLARPLTRALAKAAGDLRAASPHLRSMLLFGHAADAYFVAGDRRGAVLAHAMRQGPMRWDRGGMTGAHNAWLLRHGWVKRGPWHWHHPSLGYDQDWRQGPPETLDATRH
jgi:hypothetical protein